MGIVGAFLRLIRLPNLLFIALTQVLFYQCIVLPSFHKHTGSVLAISQPAFLFLLLASLSIAAGGYVINDYFDLNIDRVNKPEKLVIEKSIPRRWAIIWHLFFSLAGITCSAYVSYLTGNYILIVFNTLAVVLLWFYSTTFKRQLLVGKVIISLLTAWVVLVIYFTEAAVDLLPSSNIQIKYLASIYKPAMLYSGFAFILSIIRETVKDMEDIKGDQRYGRKTLAVVWGMPSAKIFTMIWLVVLVVALSVLSVYQLLLGNLVLPLIYLAGVILPSVFVMMRLWNASSAQDYATFSRWLKLAMLAGTSTMIFLAFS